MIVSNLRKATIGAVAAFATMAISVPDAEAWWRHGSSGGSWGSSGGSSGGSWGSSGGSSGGSWGSSGGSYGSSGGSWGSSGGSHGSSGGIIHRIRARRAWRHYHHSSGGSSGGSWGSSGGSWGSSGGSHGSHGSSGGSSGGSHGSWGSNGGTAVESYQVTPDQPQNGAPQDAPMDQPPLSPEASAAGDQVNYSPSARSVLMGVRVPSGAKVFVNGRETRSRGARRWYVSRGLQPGREYAYQIRAELDRNGETLVETRDVQIRSGGRADVEFRFDASRTAQRDENEEQRTTLILRVPDDAKVILSGHETKASGPVREFSTTKLADDGQWADYAVRVELTRDGETLIEERNITLSAGQTQDVTIDFDAPQVAQALAEVSR